MASTQNGSECPKHDTTDLGLAMLIVEAEDGQYQPVSVVGSLSEASEMARCDMLRRMREVEAGTTPMCPAFYKVWARGANGDYGVAYTIEAISLAV
jgi:hypothetical protein